jgi:hypothetical protein
MIKTPLEVTIQDVTVESLLKVCYMGSVLGYKFYEPVREQCLFNALREDLQDNFLAVKPKKGLMGFMFKSKLRREIDNENSRLRASIADIRDEYINIASGINGRAVAASIFGTKARLKIVLEVLSKMTPNPFPKTTSALKNGVLFDRIVVYDHDRSRRKTQDSDGDYLLIDERCFFLTQAHLFAFLQAAKIFNLMDIDDIVGRKFVPRGRCDPR